MTQNGRVVASFGHQYVVEADGIRYGCVTRGKQTGIACGDRVDILLTGPAQAVIECVLPRNNLLYRSVAHRSKLIAANVELAVVVVAPIPSYYEILLNRCLIAAAKAGVHTLICINKSDMDEAASTHATLACYEALGIPLVHVSAHHDISALLPHLQQRTSVFVGQSGMGKSSLINALIPDAASATGAISTALDSGRHTTTGARMYHLNSRSQLIDSPGMQAFGLHHILPAELDHLFIEFRSYIGQCRFHNCRHEHEPGCAIRAACLVGEILPARMAAYLDILAELKRQ